MCYLRYTIGENIEQLLVFLVIIKYNHRTSSQKNYFYTKIYAYETLGNYCKVL